MTDHDTGALDAYRDLVWEERLDEIAARLAELPDHAHHNACMECESLELWDWYASAQHAADWHNTTTGHETIVDGERGE